jgi:primosomal protein N' (replication factor Y)
MAAIVEGEGRAAASRGVAVLLPLPLERPYDYRVPDGDLPAPGALVRVPLGKRDVVGVVWGPATGEVEPARLRDVIEVLPLPPLTAELRALVDWTARYTLSPAGAVLRMALSVPSAFDAPKVPLGYRRAALPPPAGMKLTPARERVLAIASSRAVPLGELATAAQVTPSVVSALAKAGVLERAPVASGAVFAAPDWRKGGVRLTPDQRAAADSLIANANGFSVTLLDGVTGSGKTEVYFEAIAAALAAGKEAVVLLPEIALTAQWLARFQARFGVAPAEWHSDLGTALRRETWRAVAGGQARVVVGARSALFLPFPDLGLIVVDEEHDSSFKQEDGVIYNARDIAVVRGRLAQIPVVLASATPSLETVINVERGRYKRIVLPERFAGAKQPEVRIADMRIEKLPRQNFLGSALRTALGENLAAGEQSMLFLNRRGYAPLTLCRSCGHRIECRNCSTWLVEHRLVGRLLCHHCGHSEGLPIACPSCGAAESFAACGPGVERLEEEVAALLPAARLAVVTSDTVGSPAAAAEFVRQVTEREIDVLIGTQIVAKGHHFPLLTLVGIVDADLGLAGGDLRAAERTFQVLHQVAGRAGREQRPGRVIVQSYMPEHPVIAALAANDRDRFMAEEAKNREERGMPPYGRLAALIVSGPDHATVDTMASALARTAPRDDGIEVWGPAEAPLRLLRGRHRRRLLLTAARDIDVPETMRSWLARVPPMSGVRVQVDIDPYSFL